MTPLLFRRSLARARRHPLLILAALLPLLTNAAPAQAPGRIAFEQFSLANGLEVVFSPDLTSQAVAVEIWYEAGARTVPRARAGMGRLFERLMFAGTEHVPPGAHGAVIADLGGLSSAEVSEEVARFGTTVPAERLNLALWLEAERMRALAINDTSVNQARLSLLEDLRDRLGREPYTGALLGGVTALYDSTTCAGYAQPAIGSTPSISAIRTEEVRRFFVERYSPTGARLVIAGNFDPDEARRLVMEYFNGIPAGRPPAAITCTGNSPVAGTGSAVTDRLASRTAVAQLYRLPPHEHPDSPALELLGIILAEGPTARLPRVLTRSLRAAVATQGGVVGDRRVPGAFLLFGVAGDGVSADSLASLLGAQAAWAGGDSLTEAELLQARTVFRATTVSGRERVGDIAAALQHAATFHGSLAAVNDEPARVLAVTLEDLRRVARTWLIPANAFTLVIAPEAES